MVPPVRTSTPKGGARAARRALPGSGPRTMADGRTLRWTRPSTGRRARRPRRSSRSRPIPARPGRASRPCRTRPPGRCATTSTLWHPRDPPSARRCLQAASRCAVGWTQPRRRGQAGDPRTARNRTGASGAGMPTGRRRGPGDTIRRWRRRAGIQWSCRRPLRRLGHPRNRRPRSGRRDPSDPSDPSGPRRVGGPRRRRRLWHLRRGGGAGSGWWPWCWWWRWSAGWPVGWWR